MDEDFHAGMHESDRSDRLVQISKRGVIPVSCDLSEFCLLHGFSSASHEDPERVSFQTGYVTRKREALYLFPVVAFTFDVVPERFNQLRRFDAGVKVHVHRIS